MTDNKPLKIGASSFLNSAPLTYGFQHDPNVVIIDDKPSRLSARLRKGELDLALVPLIDVLFSDDLNTIQGLGVGADGPVRSVKLRCQVPLKRVESVRLDPASSTSNCLAQLLFIQRFKQQVCWLPAETAGGDAAVIIGDPALHNDPNCAEEFDLAEEWKQLTGLPFVFAVWAYRRDNPYANELYEKAMAAHAFGKKHLNDIVSEGAEKLKLPPALVHEYISGTLRYEQGPREREAMRKFKELLDLEHIKPATCTTS
ncbi:MAG: menaquinone biosynthesis protein [Kiritimatiellae bacterium]|nr:menaquinone biosynthesis protein [Kiritimatiellia bacterium]